MKRNKVLLGLYVGLLTLAGGVANAQTGKFYEIGPDNIGGEVSSIVVDRQDTSRNTLYAGAATGGLFLRSQSVEILRNLYNNLGVAETMAETLSNSFDTWHHVPYMKDGKEISLPISCMVQGPNNELYIGTGSDDNGYGSTYAPMSRKGMGLYRYIPSTGQFVLIPTTATTNDTAFSVINSLALYHDGSTMYLYAGTNSGLFRWVMADGSDNWNATPTRVFAGRVDEIVIARPHRTAFFSSGNQLYRIGDVTAAPANLRAINISSSNTAFGGSNIAIKLAVSQTDTTFLYAMVINQMGMMDALYMTNNEQTWTALTTSTVKPLTYNNGKNCGAIAIDPSNPRRVIIGGTDVLVGEGYTDGSYFQWTAASSSEFSLNYGNYMSTVFSNTSFVHSGIHQIVPVYHIDGESDYHTVFFATDGGIFASKFRGRRGFDTIQSISRGLNNLEINSLAVSPDGTIVMGANKNACPVVEARLNHFGGNANLSWYDNGELGNLNHEANIIWDGNGGAVAASMFQQVWPQPRRTIFTTSNQNVLGRTYADYLDYTNTTTWTTGEGMLTEKIVSGPAVGSISLWETHENTAFNRYVTMAVDTLGYILRLRSGQWDTMWVNDTMWGNNRGSRFQIQRGDKAIFYSRGSADYPFEYTFTRNQLAKDSVTVINPNQSRMTLIASELIEGSGANAVSYYNPSVWYAWDATDFSKVFNRNDAESAVINNIEELYERLLYWAPIYTVNHGLAGNANIYPRQAVFSKDGLKVFISVYNTATHESMIVRVSGFENVDYTLNNKDLVDAMKYGVGDPILEYDTLKYQGSIWLPRPISNMVYDSRNGVDRLLLTFEDYSDAMANFAIVNNVSSSSYSFTQMPLADATMPVYTAMVEDSTGTIYVGTENGVFTKTNTGAWRSYDKLSGVPVTAIVQQTANLPTRRNLTHTGITANNYVFAKTKWPRAIYFGTYGRGVFMDMQYVTDTTNEVVDSTEYEPVGIPTVYSTGMNSVKLFPNPVYNETNVVVNAQVAGTAVLRVYDLNGRVVVDRKLGYVAEGEHSYTLDCTGMNKGMYLVNVIIGGHTSAVKMVVR